MKNSKCNQAFTLNVNTARRNILRYKLAGLKLLNQNRLFFSWIFNVTYRRRFNFSRFIKKTSRSSSTAVNMLNFQKIAPSINLRFYALQVRLYKHGHKAKARKLLERLLILLSENIQKQTGVKVLNRVLFKLEPPYDITSIRRGSETFIYPVAIWAARRRFLAARLLVFGAEQFQRLHRCSFLVALYSEVLAFYNQSISSFTKKLYKHFIKLGLKNKHVAKRFTKYRVF